MRLGQPRPSITARLTSTLLDVADVDPSLVRAPRSEGAKTAPPPAAAPGGKADDRLIPDLPVDTDALTRADLDLEWKIKRLALGDAAADDVEARLEVKDGRLALKPLSARVGDGRLDGELAIDGTGRPATMRLGLVAEGIEAGALLKDLRLTDAVSGAKTALRLDLQAKGGSLRGLLARTDGDVTLIVDNGVIGNAYVDLLAFDLIRAIAPWTPREDMTRMQCLVARFAIRNGLAKSQALLFDTSHMTMGGSGTVNLASEGLDLTLVPRAKQASLVNLAIPMDVGAPSRTPRSCPTRPPLPSAWRARRRGGDHAARRAGAPDHHRHGRRQPLRRSPRPSHRQGAGRRGRQEIGARGGHPGHRRGHRRAAEGDHGPVRSARQ